MSTTFTKTITLTGADALRHLVDVAADRLAQADGAGQTELAEAAEDVAALLGTLGDDGTVTFTRSYNEATGTERRVYRAPEAGPRTVGEPAEISASWRGTTVTVQFESEGGLWLDLLDDIAERLESCDAEGADLLAAQIMVGLHDHDQQLAALDAHEAACSRA